MLSLDDEPIETLPECADCHRSTRVRLIAFENDSGSIDEICLVCARLRRLEEDLI